MDRGIDISVIFRKTSRRGATVVSASALMPVVVAVVTFFVSGCTGPFLSPHLDSAPYNVEVSLPPLGTHYGAVTAVWYVSWWDGRDVTERRLGPVGTDRAVSFSLEISAGGTECIVVSAVPTIYPPEVVMRSAGGWVYPPDRAISLTEKRGVLASTLLRLAQEGLDPGLVNIERIQRAIEDEYVLGARRIDVRRLEEGLRSLAFRRYHVRQLSEPDLEIRILQSDMERVLGDARGLTARKWFTDDQWNPWYEAVPAGNYLVWSVPVAAGSTRYLWRFDPAGSGMVQKMALSRSAQGHERYHFFPFR